MKKKISHNAINSVLYGKYILVVHNMIYQRFGECYVPWIIEAFADASTNKL
jgi:hypothetical protein